MKICILSDTHMPKKSKQLPSVLVEHLRQVELIIHAGDWQTQDVYDELKKYAVVEGVYGNVDSEDIKALVPKKQILHLKSYKIGIVHGDGQGKTTEKRALAAFEGEDVDMIIFGHSHIPLKKMCEHILLFNPGSPTDKRRQSAFSFGIMELKDEIKVDHIFYESKD